MTKNNRLAIKNVTFSLIFLFIGLALLLLYIFKAKELISSGIDEKIFYILLIPLGFSAAAFLFGALKSYAHYSGKHIHGTLELGGPIIVFILTVIGGFKLVSKSTPFDYLFIIVDSNGNTRNTLNCYLQLHVGSEIKESKIEEGKARFYGIPFNYKSNHATIYLKGDGWVFKNEKAKQSIILSDQSQEIAVIKDSLSDKASGYILGRNDNNQQNVKALKGVLVTIGRVSTYTDSSGYFEIPIKEGMGDEPFDANLFIKGYQPQHILLFPSNRQETRVILDKE